jgi:Fur family peroxide stress response transcriptional regulator
MNGERTTIDGIKRFLMKEGINPSYQRLKIFEYLLNHRVHPTVDTIYSNLSKHIPTLSKTTIYNTLNLFEQREIIKSLTIEKNELRYECDLRPHSHFKCMQCGQVYDIWHELPLITEKIVDGHQVTEQQLYLKGICKNCLHQ